MNCRLVFVNHVHRTRNEYIPLHRHNCHELVYYISGSGTSSIENTDYNYSSGDFTIIEPGCIHDENHELRTEVLFIGFQCDNPSAALKTDIYTDDSQGTILQCLTAIKREITEHKIFFQQKVDLLLQQLIIEIARIERNTTVRNYDFSYVKRYIKENFNQAQDLKALAALSGYSYHHFRHLFKDKTGCSPVNYLIECRIEKAKELLKQSSLSMSQISAECGFSNESQFSALFKRSLGLTPSMFRKSKLAASG